MKLTLKQSTTLHDDRATLINKANSENPCIIFAGLKLPAKIAGSRLEHPIIFSGNLTFEISWKLVERIADCEVKQIDF